MSLNVKKLNRRAVNQRQIDAIVREQLGLIYAAVGRVPTRWGTNSVSFDLPQNLAFSGLEKKDAQCVVYYGIVRQLTKDGYDVKIRSSERKTILVLEWTTGIPQDELDEMTQYLAKFTVSDAPTLPSPPETDRSNPDRNYPDRRKPFRM
jgi:hypothetical protein